MIIKLLSLLEENDQVYVNFEDFRTSSCVIYTKYIIDKNTNKVLNPQFLKYYTLID